MQEYRFPGRFASILHSQTRSQRPHFYVFNPAYVEVHGVVLSCDLLFNHRGRPSHSLGAQGNPGGDSGSHPTTETYTYANPGCELLMLSAGLMKSVSLGRTLPPTGEPRMDAERLQRSSLAAARAASFDERSAVKAACASPSASLVVVTPTLQQAGRSLCLLKSAGVFRYLPPLPP